MTGMLVAGWLGAVGWAGWATRPTVPRRPWDRRPRAVHRRPSPPRRRLGLVVAATLAVAVAAPPVAPLVPVCAAVVHVRRRRAAAERSLDELRGELAEVVDLLALATAGGFTVPLALAAVAPRAPGRVGAELRRVVREIGAGRRSADAIESLPERLGEPARPVTVAMVAAERDGAPLTASLERLAAELRADRRRRAEEAARRLPIRLLFPLVCCVLPAFALLTVVPMLAGALRSLRL